MYLLALRAGRAARHAERRAPTRAGRQRQAPPALIAELLDAGSEEVDRVAERFKDAEFFLYLGRHIGLPVCLEGALKLKEISYTATDAYAAGEMKHGPIALLDEGTPVVVVATDSPVLDKVISNMQEVRARGAAVIAVGGRRGRAARRRRAAGPRGGLDAPAAARGHPAAAAGLPDRAPARAERRPAAQPGEDRHCGVMPRSRRSSASAASARRRSAACSSSRWKRARSSSAAGRLGDEVLSAGVEQGCADGRDRRRARRARRAGCPPARHSRAMRSSSAVAVMSPSRSPITTMSGCRSVASRSASVASLAVNTPARARARRRASRRGRGRGRRASTDGEPDLLERRWHVAGELGVQVLLDVARAAGRGELLGESHRRAARTRPARAGTNTVNSAPPSGASPSSTVAAVQLRRTPARSPAPGPCRRAPVAVVGGAEALEQDRALLGRHADAAVGDLEPARTSPCSASAHAGDRPGGVKRSALASRLETTRLTRSGSKREASSAASRRRA